MSTPDVADIDDVIFEKTDTGFVIRAATFPHLVRRSLNDFDANGPVDEACKFSSTFFPYISDVFRAWRPFVTLFR